MDRGGLSRSLPFLPRYHSLSPIRPTSRSSSFTFRSASQPNNRQSVIYINGEKSTITNHYPTHRPPRHPSPLSTLTSSAKPRSTKIILLNTKLNTPLYRISNSNSWHDVHSSHLYSSYESLRNPKSNHEMSAKLNPPLLNTSTSCDDIYHKGPYFPDSSRNQSESGISASGSEDFLEDETTSQLSFGSSSAFFETTVESDMDVTMNALQIEKGLVDIGQNGANRHFDRISSSSSSLSYAEARKRELSSPTIGFDPEKYFGMHGRLKTNAAQLNPPCIQPLNISVHEFENHCRDNMPFLTTSCSVSDGSFPVAQSTPLVSPTGVHGDFHAWAVDNRPRSAGDVNHISSLGSLRARLPSSRSEMNIHTITVYEELYGRLACSEESVQPNINIPPLETVISFEDDVDFGENNLGMCEKVENDNLNKSTSLSDPCAFDWKNNDFKIEKPVDKGIPLINAGKFGQEKLKKSKTLQEKETPIRCELDIDQCAELFEGKQPHKFLCENNTNKLDYLPYKNFHLEEMERSCKLSTNDITITDTNVRSNEKFTCPLVNDVDIVFYDKRGYGQLDGLMPGVSRLTEHVTSDWTDQQEANIRQYGFHNDPSAVGQAEICHQVLYEADFKPQNKDRSHHNTENDLNKSKERFPTSDHNNTGILLDCRTDVVMKKGNYKQEQSPHLSWQDNGTLLSNKAENMSDTCNNNMPSVTERDLPLYKNNDMHYIQDVSDNCQRSNTICTDNDCAQKSNTKDSHQNQSYHFELIGLSGQSWCSDEMQVETRCKQIPNEETMTILHDRKSIGITSVVSPSVVEDIICESFKALNLSDQIIVANNSMISQTPQQEQCGDDLHKVVRPQEHSFGNNSESNKNIVTSFGGELGNERLNVSIHGVFVDEENVEQISGPDYVNTRTQRGNICTGGVFSCLKCGACLDGGRIVDGGGVCGCILEETLGCRNNSNIGRRVENFKDDIVDHRNNTQKLPEYMSNTVVTNSRGLVLSPMIADVLNERREGSDLDNIDAGVDNVVMKYKSSLASEDRSTGISSINNCDIRDGLMKEGIRCEKDERGSVIDQISSQLKGDEHSGRAGSIYDENNERNNKENQNDGDGDKEGEDIDFRYVRVVTSGQVEENDHFDVTDVNDKEEKTNDNEVSVEKKITNTYDSQCMPSDESDCQSNYCNQSSDSSRDKTFCLSVSVPLPNQVTHGIRYSNIAGSAINGKPRADYVALSSVESCGLNSNPEVNNVQSTEPMIGKESLVSLSSTKSPQFSETERSADRKNEIVNINRMDYDDVDGQNNSCLRSFECRVDGRCRDSWIHQDMESGQDFERRSINYSTGGSEWRGNEDKGIPQQIIMMKKEDEGEEEVNLLLEKEGEITNQTAQKHGGEEVVGNETLRESERWAGNGLNLDSGFSVLYREGSVCDGVEVDNEGERSTLTSPLDLNGEKNSCRTDYKNSQPTAGIEKESSGKCKIVKRVRKTKVEEEIIGICRSVSSNENSSDLLDFTANNSPDGLNFGENRDFNELIPHDSVFDSNISVSFRVKQNENESNATDRVVDSVTYSNGQSEKLIEEKLDYFNVPASEFFLIADNIDGVTFSYPLKFDLKTDDNSSSPYIINVKNDKENNHITTALEISNNSVCQQSQELFTLQVSDLTEAVQLTSNFEPRDCNERQNSYYETCLSNELTPSCVKDIKLNVNQSEVDQDENFVEMRSGSHNGSRLSLNTNNNGFKPPTSISYRVTSPYKLPPFPVYQEDFTDSTNKNTHVLDNIQAQLSEMDNNNDNTNIIINNKRHNDNSFRPHLKNAKGGGLITTKLSHTNESTPINSQNQLHYEGRTNTTPIATHLLHDYISNNGNTNTPDINRFIINSGGDITTAINSPTANNISTLKSVKYPDTGMYKHGIEYLGKQRTKQPDTETSPRSAASGMSLLQPAYHYQYEDRSQGYQKLNLDLGSLNYNQHVSVTATKTTELGSNVNSVSICSGNEDKLSHKSSIDNDYDYLPSDSRYNGHSGNSFSNWNIHSSDNYNSKRGYSSHHHHHHHGLMMKSGHSIVKSSSLWTLQEETESLLDGVSPSRPLNLLENESFIQYNEGEKQNNLNLSSHSPDSGVSECDRSSPLTRENNTSLIYSTPREDLICKSTGISLESSNIMYSENTTCPSQIEKRVSNGTLSFNYTPFMGPTRAVNHTLCTNNAITNKIIGVHSPLNEISHDETPSDIDIPTRVPKGGVKFNNLAIEEPTSDINSFSDFVSGLELGAGGGHLTNNSRPGHAPSLNTSNQIRSPDGIHQAHALISPTVFKQSYSKSNDSGLASFYSQKHVPSFTDMNGDDINSTRMQIDNIEPALFTPIALTEGQQEFLINSSTASNSSNFSSIQDLQSEPSSRLRSLDLDLSLISSCASPVPSDYSEASGYTCTGTAEVKKSASVSFEEDYDIFPCSSPKLYTPSSTPRPQMSSTPRPKINILKSALKNKQPPNSVGIDKKSSERTKHAEWEEQFDQIIHDFNKKTNPLGSNPDITVLDDTLNNQTSNENVLVEKCDQTKTESLYGDFMNDDTEKKQNNICMVVEDENMVTYRFKRFLKKSHTRRNKHGKRIVNFLSRLSCVSESFSPPSPEHIDSENLTTKKARLHNGQSVTTEFIVRGGSSSPQNDEVSSNIIHRKVPIIHQTDHNSPTSSNHSLDSLPSRADSAYSSVSESVILHAPFTNNSSHNSFSYDRLSPTPSTPCITMSQSDSVFSSVSEAETTATTPLTPSNDYEKASDGDYSADMLAALSEVFEQLDVCGGQIDQALLRNFRYARRTVTPKRCEAQQNN